MAKKKQQIFERILDDSPTLERIDPSELEEGLGANREPGESAATGSPFSVLALRSRLLSDLVSTGGRPGRKEAVLRKKISLTETEWQILDQITELINGRGVNATSGQVAGVLLHQSITEVLQRLEKVAPPSSGSSGLSATVSDQDLEETVDDILAAAASAEAHLGQLKPVALELLRRMRERKKAQKNDK